MSKKMITPRQLLKHLTVKDGQSIDASKPESYIGLACKHPKDEVWLFEKELIRFISIQSEGDGSIIMVLITTPDEYVLGIDERFFVSSLIRLPNKPIPFE